MPYVFGYLQVRLGKDGVEEIFGLGPLSEFEQKGLDNLKAELKSSIEKGIEFANKNWELWQT